ncbi:acetyl-CoA carboxylase biotin carboxyl carrier protein subunit [Fodinisporobacter ferrooxydans]|uniref:Acetyl-CoA carboxylase biotin carboxyl carrier protein subunit n=1 Tax=Fodinisporobacter ferrooxydans TaxID=2901836 RepID=A0ABY4CF32_9BACL|nr:acetyl-CoA carboxylase biotin carboxyl carrier protein subunit [Alicyclobacillaceae bacterium MYW30-H2]
MAAIHATMAGTVLQVLVSEGDSVQAGQDVILLESMKMEVPISSEQTGIVKNIRVTVGDFVNDEDVLIELE